MLYCVIRSVDLILVVAVQLELSGPSVMLWETVNYCGNITQSMDYCDTLGDFCGFADEYFILG